MLRCSEGKQATAEVATAESHLSAAELVADHEKRWRRHFPKSIDKSFETHFALSISRLLSSFAFLYTFTGRKGA